MSQAKPSTGLYVQCKLKPPETDIMFITARNSSCGKVMFSQECVKNSVHRRGCLPKRMLGYRRAIRILLECIPVKKENK